MPHSMIQELFGSTPILYGLWALVALGLLAFFAAIWAVLDYLPRFRFRVRLKRVPAADWRLKDLPPSPLDQSLGQPIGERRRLNAIFEAGNVRTFERKAGRG